MTTDDAGLRRIGPYIISGDIGMGSFGRVRTGIDQATQRHVVIKTLVLSEVDEDTAAACSQVMRREAMAGERLDHERILKVLEGAREKA